MNEAVLQRLNEAQAALGAALDLRDIDALDSAAAALATAITDVRAAGGWGDQPGLRQDVLATLRRADILRGQLNLLADANRRKLDALMSLTGQPPARPYQRSGKLA